MGSGYLGQQSRPPLRGARTVLMCWRNPSDCTTISGPLTIMKHCKGIFVLATLREAWRRRAPRPTSPLDYPRGRSVARRVELVIIQEESAKVPKADRADRGSVRGATIAVRRAACGSPRVRAGSRIPHLSRGGRFELGP